MQCAFLLFEVFNIGRRILAMKHRAQYVDHPWRPQNIFSNCRVPAR